VLRLNVVGPLHLAREWSAVDCFSGSGGILSSGLDHGASEVIGVEKEGRYVEITSLK